MVILENIDIDKAILQNIDIDKISNRFKFGISNRASLDRPMTMCRLQTPPGRFSSISLLQSESRTQCNGAGSCTELIALILLATIMSATKTNPRGIIYNADALNRTKELSSKPRALFLCLDGCSVAQVYVGLAEQYLQKTRGGSSCSNASLIEWLVSSSVSPLSDLY